MILPRYLYRFVFSPPFASAQLTSRYSNRCYNGNRSYNCNSPWHRWGRWVLAGVLIAIAVVLLFFLLYVPRTDIPLLLRHCPPTFHLASKFYMHDADRLLQRCLRNRRRRRNMIATPMTTQPPVGGYTTGGYNNQSHGNQGYGQNQRYGQDYAPPQGPPPPGGGYYGQEGGITQPGNTYHGGYK